ncbi:MAG: MerR family transcriptional regulator [Planctomycetota bacterium]
MVTPEGERLYPTGQVMERAGVTRQQIYQYTAMGLIEEAQLDRHGYRLYPERVFERLRLIRGLRDRGYSLQEMKEIFFRRAQRDADAGRP